MSEEKERRMRAELDAAVIFGPALFVSVVIFVAVYFMIGAI